MLMVIVGKSRVAVHW